MSEALGPILIVEDEKEIRELMALHLLRQGYRVHECESAEESMKELDSRKFSLVILDWMLPGMAGVDFIEHVRRHTPAPNVLMVTARTEAQDIVRGLEKGADDYLTKPFEPSVLIARVKALLRRSQLAAKKSNPDEAQVGDLKINFATYEVHLGGEKLHLTPSEYKLLMVMIAHRGKVLTRDQLIENIQGEGINVIGRTIDTHVFGLRKKLGNWSDNIETIRGIGYRVKVE